MMYKLLYCTTVVLQYNPTFYIYAVRQYSTLVLYYKIPCTDGVQIVLELVAYVG
jgi:hypothetical protein